MSKSAISPVAVANKLDKIEDVNMYKVLSTATDFNTLKTSDKYPRHYYGNDINIHSNTPVSINNTPFAVDVIPMGGYVRQVVYLYGTTVRTFHRNTSYNSGGDPTWTNWKENVNTTPNDSNFNNFHCNRYWNTTSMTLDIGFTPTVGQSATGVLINGNQHTFVILKLDTEPTATVLDSSRTFTITNSGSTFTITPSGTLWGVSMILWSHN